MENQGMTFPWYMPEELRNILRSWPILVKSPHSFSYYDTKDKTWENTPLNSLRVSDHWNFYSKKKGHEKIHCPLQGESTKGEWIVAKWDGGIYIPQDRFRFTDWRDVPKKEVIFLKAPIQRKWARYHDIELPDQLWRDPEYF